MRKALNKCLKLGIHPKSSHFVEPELLEKKIFGHCLLCNLVTPQRIVHWIACCCWEKAPRQSSLSLSLLRIPLRFDDLLHLQCLPNKPIEKECWSLVSRTLNMEGHHDLIVSHIFSWFFDWSNIAKTILILTKKSKNVMIQGHFPLTRGGFCGEERLASIKEAGIPTWEHC